MLITVFDPGETTGHVTAMLTIEDRDFTITPVSEGEVRFPQGLKRVLLNALSSDVVIVEDFVVRKPLIGDKVVAARVIGAIQVIVPQIKLRFQQPLTKSGISDIILKERDLLRPSPHVKDAYRHLIAFALGELKRARRNGETQRRVTSERQT